MGNVISTTYNLGLYQEEGQTWPCHLSMMLLISYRRERGSPVYTCSLDAQGAFNAITHAVLFRKGDGCNLITAGRS